MFAGKDEAQTRVLHGAGASICGAGVGSNRAMRTGAGRSRDKKFFCE